MIVDGVNLDDLIRMMNTPVAIDEGSYLEWKNKKLREAHPRRKVYIRGSDFTSYWKCARRLSYDVHSPLPSKSYANKGTYKCIVRHQQIEAFLEKRGWLCEELIKKELFLFGRYVPGLGHYDAFSPSRIILDIKHGRHSFGNVLQTGFYQVLKKPTKTRILLLYRDGIEYYTDLSRIIEKYLPRVYACVATDVLPPLHPDFPRCYRACEYFKRDGRKRVPPKQDKQEWVEWFRKTQSLLERN